MKVCHITSVHSANDTRIFIKECSTLQNHNHEVFYIVPNAQDTEKNGVKIIGVETKEEGKLNRIKNTTKYVYLKALEVDADVYHFHDPELIPTGLKLKSKGKMVIYDVHEDVPEQILSKQWIPKPLRKSISMMVKYYESFAAKKFDAIMAATPTIANRFKPFNSNTIVLHNYPLLNELSKGATQTEQTEQNNILYIGGIYLLRGIKEMIRSVEILNEDLGLESKLVLAGEYAPKSLEDEVRRLSGYQYVDFVGFLGREEVKKALSNAKMGLVLLHPEPRFIVSMPIKMFEYMSAGIPVVASNFPLWREIVEQNNCGICVDPLNEQEIAEKMKWLLENPKDALKMGENGRIAVETIYNWESESKKLTQLYSQLESI